MIKLDRRRKALLLEDKPMAVTLVKDGSNMRRVNTDSSVYRLGYKLSWLFRCWHRKMSRPFTRDGRTFCVCLRCGMRRNFDLEAWKSTGDYYYGSDLSEPRTLPLRKGTKQ
jgi:hypothetical protein